MIGLLVRSGYWPQLAGERGEDRITRTDDELLGVVGDHAGHHVGLGEERLVGEDLAAGDVELAGEVVGDLDRDGEARLAVAVVVDDAGIVRVGGERLVERVVEPDADRRRRRRPTDPQHAVDDVDLERGRGRLDRLRGGVGQRRADRLVGALLGETERRLVDELAVDLGDVVEPVADDQRLEYVVLVGHDVVVRPSAHQLLAEHRHRFGRCRLRRGRVAGARVAGGR